MNMADLSIKSIRLTHPLGPVKTIGPRERGPVWASSRKIWKLQAKSPNDTKAPRSAQSGENSTIARKAKATCSQIHPERKSKMTEREEIRKLLEANAGKITDNIAEFLIRNVEDLIAVGVDERILADAMLRIAFAHMIKLDGLPTAVAEMRSRADDIEKIGAQFRKPAELN